MQHADEGAVAPGPGPAPPARATSVASQTALILGSRVLGAASTAVLTIVLARNLGLDGYGDYALAFTIASLAAVFASLGVDSSTSRFVAEGYNTGRGFARVLKTGLKLRTVIAGTVFGALIIVAGPLASAFGEPDLANAVRAAAIALFFSAGFSWVSGVFEGVRQGGMLALISVIKSVVEFAVVLTVLLLGFGAIGALLGNAVAYAAAVGYALLVIRRYVRRLDTGPEVQASGRRILRYGNHIWLAGVAWLLFDRVDLLMLGAFLGTDAVGLYDAPWRISTILGLLGLSLASAVTPRIASVDATVAGALLTKALRVALVFYLVLGVITAVAAPDLIVTLLGEEFRRSAEVLQVLLPYVVLIGLAPVLSRALDYIGVASVRKWIALGATLVNIVLDLILIPTVGLLGAALATDIAIFAFVAGHYVLVARHVPMDRAALVTTIVRGGAAAAAAGAACFAVLAVPGPDLVLLALAYLFGIAVGAAVLIVTGEMRDEALGALRAARRRAGTHLAQGSRAGADQRRLAIAACGAALVIGLGVGRSPFLVVGAMVGLTLVALLLSDITAGVVAFVLLQPLALLVPGGEAAVAKGAGLLLLGTWLVSLRYPSSRRRYLGFIANNPLLVGLIAAFMGWCVASVLWTIDTASSWDAIQRYALGFLLLMIVFTATRDRRAALLIAGAFTLSAGASALIGLVMGNRIEDRFVGTFADANEFAAFCVPAVLLAAAFAAVASTPLRRFAFGVTALLCGLGIVLSGSRGGIIAMAAALVVWIVFGGRWRLRLLATSAMLVLVLVGYISFAASPETRARIETITQGQDYGTSAGTGRADIWQVGMRAYREHPTKGSGAGTFTEATPRYLAQPGLVRRIDFFTETPKVAHNQYLHILVELGTVGLALFSAILLCCLAAVTRAALLFKRAGDTVLELISRSLLAGTVGLLVADFFLSGQYARVLWILLGLCVGMLGVARVVAARVPATRPAEEGPIWTRGRVPKPGRRGPLPARG